ncbi:MmgE/PrpD family protein [Leucobacter denitrificans]|uniref:MmgE/PrpD family protein n=1 Tax=Leucobacter denitrificans TaxID=683042 RepID=A0A7G9S491_9MICO|nr:MmgE/PrpD family protein [Leucobacter denitrificans]QNN62666.1 MmgE/PrpD family protein [Leucobacter denitrificans]
MSDAASVGDVGGAHRPSTPEPSFGPATGPARFGAAAAQIMANGIPADVDEWSRWALLDTVAVAVGGAGTRVTRAAIAAAGRHLGAAPLLVAPGSASPEWAALVLSTAANALDYDDGHVEGGGIHAGSTVVGTLLAAAPDTVTTAQLRSAMVIGYEVAIRAGYLASPDVSGHDYRTSGYAAAIGAAAAASAATGSDEMLDAPAPPTSRTALIAAAIRLATAHAPVASFVSGGARESTGWAALTAVGTVELALSGLAPSAEEERAVVPAGPTLFDPAGAAPKSRWYNLDEGFLAPGCYFKPYPCCRAAHAAIDATLELLDSGALDPLTDSPIFVGLPAGAAALTERRPVDLGEAQFAVPFLIGLTIARGVDGLRSLGRVPLKSLVGDPEIQRQTDRVRLEVDPDLDADPGTGYPARVTVGDDPTHNTVTIRDALGSPQRPLDKQARLRKAHDLLVPAAGPAAASKIIDALVDPPADQTLAQLRALLTTHLATHQASGEV